MMQQDFSVLIGGKAGEGINVAGQTIAQILAKLGYRVGMYYDNPSRIKGGHNFAIIRGAEHNVCAVREYVHIILAMDQETVHQHEQQLTDDGVILFNSDAVRHPKGIGIPVREIMKTGNAPAIMGNSVLIGALIRAIDLDWEIAKDILTKANPKETELNLQMARSGYDASHPVFSLPSLSLPTLPVFTGNEVIGLGLIEAGIELYVAYPMSPTSNLLTFLALQADDVHIRVFQPESETAAILIALGAAYAGSRSVVGTSGGGFCLMTEALGFSGIAEIPALIVLGQRAGPSTGLATYSAQADLQFALNASQGEFPRLVVAPGDLEELWMWSRISLDFAWKYQLPAILLPDRILCEGVYTVDPGEVSRYPVSPLPEEVLPGLYHRYAYTDSGVSPMKFPPVTDAVIRINSHVHDTDGITTEEASITKAMADKRNKKMESLYQEIEQMDPVHVGGNLTGETGILCWGSNKGICLELGKKLGLRVLQPVVLSPFPTKAFQSAMQGVSRLVSVETNETGQLTRLVREHGYRVDETLLKYDGRPYTVDELESELRRVLA